MINMIDQNPFSHPNLDMDVLSDGIFSKLIYKDLFNCGTVCKDWSKLIRKVMNSSEIVFGMLIESKGEFVNMRKERLLSKINDYNEFKIYFDESKRYDKNLVEIDFFSYLRDEFSDKEVVLGFIADAQKQYDLALDHYCKWVVGGEYCISDKEMSSTLEHMIYLSKKTGSMFKLLTTIFPIKYYLFKIDNRPAVTHLIAQKDMLQLSFEEVLREFYTNKLSDKKCYMICPCEYPYDEVEDIQNVKAAKRFYDDLAITGIKISFPIYNLNCNSYKNLFQAKILEADFVFIFNSELLLQFSKGSKRELELARARGIEGAKTSFFIHAKQASTTSKGIQDLSQNAPINISSDYHEKIITLLSTMSGVDSKDVLDCFNEKVQNILYGKMDYQKLDAWRKEKYKLGLSFKI